MSKKAVTTLSVQSTVPTALEMLQNELANLTKIAETPYKCGTNLPEFGNIQVEMNIESLIRANSSVMYKERAYNESILDLGLDGIPVKSFGADFGGSREDWRHDIKLRINILNQEKRRKELEDLVNEAKSYMTKEDQYAIFINKLNNFVGNQQTAKE